MAAAPDIITSKLRALVQIQGQSGNWDYSPYMLGMYNGMEVMLAAVEGRNANTRTAPKRWLDKKENK